MPALAPHRNDQIRSALGARRANGTPGWLPDLPGTLTPKELAAMLERNGFPGAASDITAGQDVKAATAYIAGRVPTYSDGEGLYLQQVIDDLHGLPEEDRRQQLNKADVGDWLLDHLADAHEVDLSGFVDSALIRAINAGIPPRLHERVRASEHVAWVQGVAAALRDAGFHAGGERRSDEAIGAIGAWFPPAS